MAFSNRGKLDDTISAMFSNPDYSKDYLFYAHMLGQCSIKIRENMGGPAGVKFSNDHYDLFIDPEYFDEYDLVGRLAILKHEMLHILGDHIHRVQDRNFTLFNIATDCAINQLINSDHLPKDGIIPQTLEEKYELKLKRFMEGEYYYDELLKEQEEQDQDFSESNNGNPMDSHETWQESEGDPDLQQDVTKKMIERSQAETIKGNGKVPSNCAEWLKLHSRKSEVNWKKELRMIVSNKKTSKRPTIMRKDRRMPHRTELRGKTRDRTFDLLVIADVSGSMSDEAVISTLQEVRQICDVCNTNVNLIQIDTVAYEPEVLTKKTNVLTRKGQGGTKLSPALEKAKEHNISYDAVVVLTDGGLWGDDISQFVSLNKKVIWLIEPTGYILEEMNSGKMKAIKLKDS